MSGSGRRERIGALVVLASIIALAIPLAASAAGASTSHTDEGHIAFPMLEVVSTTEAEWKITCPSMPDSQGEDAYVFELPAELVTDGTTTTAAGRTATAYDLDIVFYGADCGVTGSSFATGTDEVAATPADTRYVVVTAYRGSDIAVTLTVGGDGGEPTPSETPTPTPTTTPSDPPDGARGTYPLTPDDPLFPEDPVIPEIVAGQWGMRRIQAPEAWQEARSTGFGIKVAVLDTGLDLGHPDFDCPGKIEIIENNDYIDNPNGPLAGPQDGNGHGTHVAGIVGACTNNGEGVVGVAPDATIMPIQVLDATGNGTVTETLPGAIRSATDAGAHVINMSIGTLPVNTPIDVLIGDVFPEVDAAVEYAVSHGVVVVAAAGNETFPMCSYPAIIEDIVCVGSSDVRDLNSYFGNFPVNDDDDNESGWGAGLLAPGGTGAEVFCDQSADHIVSTILRSQDDCNDPHVGYAGENGTSMASPHVAGAAALVYDRLGASRTEANGRQIIEALISNTDDLYAPGWDPASGYGRLNALKAVQSVDPAPEPSPSPTVTEPPPPAATSLSFAEGTPLTGQFSDGVSVSAKLTDDSGRALAGEMLSFQIVGAAGLVEASALTGLDGVASQTLSLDIPPGAYDLAVAYSGKTSVYNASSDSSTFQVLKEDSAISLAASDKGSKRRLTATLTDADDSSTPVVGALVTFIADGKQVGTATTEANGVATLDVPSGSKGGKVRWEAHFSGNDFYVPSSAATP